MISRKHSRSSLRNLKLAVKSKNFNSPKHRRNQSRMMKNLWRYRRSEMMKGPLNSSKNPKTRRLRSRIMKSLQEKGVLGWYSPSKIQISIFRFLCRMGVRGIKLEHKIGSKKIDIALIRKKIALEIDGAFWHRNKSSSRDQYIRRRGWRVKHIVVENNYHRDELFRRALNACV